MPEYGYGVTRKIEQLVKNVKYLLNNQNPSTNATPERFTKFENKRIAAIGDSITADNSYLSPLSQKLGTTVVQNLGIGGQTYTDGVFNGQANSILADTALMILAGGINDFRLNKPLGTVSDMSGVSTFYSALYTTYKNATSRIPNAKFITVLPYNNYDWMYPQYPSYNQANSVGLYLWDYINAIKQRAGMFGIPIANIYGESGISEHTHSKYLADGIHLNATGGQLVASLIADKIKTTPYYSL